MVLKGCCFAAVSLRLPLKIWITRYKLTQYRVCTTRCRRWPITVAVPYLPWRKACDTEISSNLICNSKYIRKDCSRQHSDRNTYLFSLFLCQLGFLNLFFAGMPYKARLLTDWDPSSRFSKFVLQPQSRTASFGYLSFWQCSRAH